jgi:tripartite-type tricarboxylate transporter receptor subunit TctC
VPSAPPLAEAGLPNYSQTGYVGIMATGGTPAPVIAKLNADINAVIKDAEFSRRFAAFGYDMVGGTVAGFEAFLKDDIERYRKLTAAAGIEPQ